MESKQNKRIIGMVLGMILGIFYGVAMDNIALGVGVGVSFGVAISNAMVGDELIKDKKTRRRMSWALLASLLLGSAVFGLLKGDLFEGLSAGIGFSFVVGLKWDKLYDERMSAMFSKAARNAFVMVNAGFSFVVFFGDVLQYTPLGPIPVITQIKTVIYLSWLVFLASWIYHANYKGE